MWKVWFPKKARDHLHHPRRMTLVITSRSSEHISVIKSIHHSSHQDNQTSIRVDGKLHRRHTIPNRRIATKIPIWAVTEILQKNKINKLLVAAWPGTRIVRLHLNYYLLEIYNNNYKIILALSTEQAKTNWDIPMKGMCTHNGQATPRQSI